MMSLTICTTQSAIRTPRQTSHIISEPPNRSTKKNRTVVIHSLAVVALCAVSTYRGIAARGVPRAFLSESDHSHGLTYCALIRVLHAGRHAKVGFGRYPTLDCWSRSGQYWTVTFCSAWAASARRQYCHDRRWIANSPPRCSFIIRCGPTPRHPPARPHQ